MAFSGKYRNDLLPAAVIFLISIMVYSNTIKGEFVWDDRGTIVSNTSIRAITNIPSFFTTDQWKISGNPASSYYRPVANTFWALEFQLWGNSPAGYHITSIILHAFVSLLLYFLCLKISGSVTSSFFSAMIFSVHPVHTENIAWITGVSYIVCAILLVSSLLLYIKFSERRTTASFAGSVICFLFAVFSYEYALMFPLILIAHEFLNSHRKIQMKVLMPFILITVFYLAARELVISSKITYDIPLYSRILTSFVIHIKYLQSFFLPVSLNIFYDVRPSTKILNPEVIISILAITAVMILMLMLYKKDKTALFAFVWFFIFLLPVSNILVIVTPQMMSLRYLYISSIGLSILSGIYIGKLSPGFRVIPAIIIILLGVGTFKQNRYWHDDITLYQKMVDDSPTSSLTRNNLGVAYIEANRLQEALKEFQIASETDHKNRFAVFNLGDTYRALGRFDEAVIYLRRTLDIDPKDSGAYNSLGLAHKNMGKHQEAEDSFILALNANPLNYEAHYNLANLLSKLGRNNEAIPHYKRFIELAPEKYDDLKNQAEKMLNNRGIIPTP